ncbi:MAG: SdrD B-like domain-containing protein [Beutenbergiaceae bacterium]
MDEITYRVDLASVDDPVSAPTLTMTFPQGQEMAAVPEICGPGSTVTPALAAPDYAGLTGTSYQALAAQTLVCNLPDIAAGTSLGYDFTTTVRPEMPNGADMGPVTATITSPDLPAPAVSNAVSQRVSAIPKWDVSINGATNSENSAFIKQGAVQRCSPGYGIPTLPGGQQQMCFVGGYPVTVSIPGKVGGSPMAGGDFTVQIDTDPVTIWGQPAIDAIVDYNASNSTSIDLSGGYVTAVQDSPYESPNSRLSQGTATNSVRNSGSTTWTQTGGAGAPVVLTVAAADTTGYTLPTQAGSPAGYTIRSDRGFVYTFRVFIEVPLNDVVENLAGLDGLAGFDQDPGSNSLRMPIRVTADESDLSFSTIDGLVDAATADTNQYSDADGTANNYRRVNALLRDWQPVYNHWTSPANYATATPPALYAPGYPAWWGPSGPAGMNRGDGVAVTGQSVLSTVTMDGDVTTGTSTMVCQAFDNSTAIVDNDAALAASAAPNQSPAQQGNSSTRFPAFSDVDDGGATWISGTMVNFQEAAALIAEGSASGQRGMADRFGAFEVQYGVGDVSDTTCEGTIDWYSSLGGVPGGAANVNKVRFLVQNQAGWNAVPQRTSVSIGLKVIATEPGTAVPTYTNYVQVPGWTSSFDALAALPASSWLRSSYDYILDAFQTGYDTPGAGRNGDMLTLVDSVVNLNKTVASAAGAALDNYNWVPANSTSTNPAYPEWARSTTDGVPTLAAGSQVTFEITPLVAANPALASDDPRRIQDVVVEDCVPAWATPDLAATTAWTFSQADLSAGVLPYTSNISCDPDETYLAWYYNDRDVVNDPIPPIQVTANILVTAPAGEFMNDAVISVDDPATGTSSVPSNVDQRTARVLYDVQGSDSLVISKTVDDPVIYLDDSGWLSSTSSTWNVVIANYDSSASLTNLDLIDFLPADGVNSSSFTAGTTTLQSVTQAPPQAGEIGNDNVTILYTGVTVTDATFADMSDPGDAGYNGATGSTTWCSYDGTAFTVASGTGACPDDMSEVTGIRVQRPGEFPNGGVIRLTLQTDATGNLNTDLVRNTAVARVDGINVPIQANAEVVYEYRDWPNNVGSISGTVWDDRDSDGVWSAAEMPIAGAAVSLLDSTGNPVLDGAGDPVVGQTDTDGNYQFTGLPAGQYTVVFTSPDGMSPTIAGLDSMGSRVEVTLSSTNQHVTGIDSGFRAPGDLDLTKAVTGGTGALVDSVQYAEVGDTLTYTIEAVNSSPERPFTEFFPARLIDDLSDVLDGASYVDGSLTATSGTATVVGDQMVWYGPLGARETVSISYQVTVTAANTATNVAFVSYPPVDPQTGMPQGPDGEPIVPEDPSHPGATDPTPTEPVERPSDCAAPDCASTSTPVSGAIPPVSNLSDTGTSVGIAVILTAVLLVLAGSGLAFSRYRRRPARS